MTEYVHPPISAALGDVETARLDLRRFRESDLDQLAEVFAQREVWQYPYGRAFDREETGVFLRMQMREWAACGFGCWAAVHKDSNRIVGYVGLSVPTFLPEILPAVEVGWRFDPRVWGQGLASEGATAALKEGFEKLKLDEVTSVPQVGNPASSRVCERIGMRFDREVVIPATSQRGELRGLLYVMTAREWEAVAPAE